MAYKIHSNNVATGYKHVIWNVPLRFSSDLLFPCPHSSCNTTDLENGNFTDFYDHPVDFAFIAFDVTFTVPNTTDSFNKTLAWVCERCRSLYKTKGYMYMHFTYHVEGPCLHVLFKYIYVLNH